MAERRERSPPLPTPTRSPSGSCPTRSRSLTRRGYAALAERYARAKAATGRTLTELTGEQADEADAMQTMAWLHLRRSGDPVPGSCSATSRSSSRLRRAGPYERRALDDLARFCRFWGMTPRQGDDALTDAEYRAFVDVRQSRDSGGQSGCPKADLRRRGWQSPRSSSITQADTAGLNKGIKGIAAASGMRARPRDDAGAGRRRSAWPLIGVAATKDGQ